MGTFSGDFSALTLERISYNSILESNIVYYDYRRNNN